MTTLLEIKPYIHDFIEENLDVAFAQKVYWLGERKNVPEYPYCLLSVIAENKDKRTSRHKGKFTEEDTRELIITRYKTCTITVGIYNGWSQDTADTMDMDEAKEFAYEQIDYLEGSFEDYPTNDLFSVQTIGYNETRTINKEIGQSVEGNLINDNIEYPFKVTITNNDTIIVETT